MDKNELKRLEYLLKVGFSYYNIRTKEGLGGVLGSREETSEIKRIINLISQNRLNPSVQG